MVVLYSKAVRYVSISTKHTLQYYNVVFKRFLPASLHIGQQCVQNEFVLFHRVYRNCIALRRKHDFSKIRYLGRPCFLSCWIFCVLNITD